MCESLPLKKVLNVSIEFCLPPGWFCICYRVKWWSEYSWANPLPCLRWHVGMFLYSPFTLAAKRKTIAATTVFSFNAEIPGQVEGVHSRIRLDNNRNLSSLSVWKGIKMAGFLSLLSLWAVWNKHSFCPIWSIVDEAFCSFNAHILALYPLQFAVVFAVFSVGGSLSERQDFGCQNNLDRLNWSIIS